MLGSLATHWAHSEDSDQSDQMPRLIWVLDGRTCHFVGFVSRRLIFIIDNYAVYNVLYSSSTLNIIDCYCPEEYPSFTHFRVFNIHMLRSATGLKVHCVVAMPHKKKMQEKGYSKLFKMMSIQQILVSACISTLSHPSLYLLLEATLGPYPTVPCGDPNHTM